SSSSEIAIPGPSVTSNQCNGRHRPPRAGGIGFRRIADPRPAFDELIAPLPCVFDLILAHKEVLIALHYFQQQTLIGTWNTRTFVSFGEIELQGATAQVGTEERRVGTVSR